MSTTIVPFESNTLPARLQNRKIDASAAPAWALGGGFPAISIKGKVFAIVRGDDRTLVTKPDSPDEPASALELIVLKAASGTSKVFYLTGYVEGSAEKPDCYSNDGLAPAKDAKAPQAKQCATCAHNQWGSRISEAGKQGKACADSVRLAVAAAGNVNDPMLLRVPAASIAALREYYKTLAGRGAEMVDVVTRVGFDYTVAHPALTFKPVGFVSDDQIGEVLQAAKSVTVGQITGEIEYVSHDAADVVVEAVPTPEPVAEKPKATKAKAAPLAAAEPPAPKVEVKPAAPVVTALESELEAALSDLDFDD